MRSLLVPGRQFTHNWREDILPETLIPRSKAIPASDFPARCTHLEPDPKDNSRKGQIGERWDLLIGLWRCIGQNANWLS